MTAQHGKAGRKRTIGRRPLLQAVAGLGLVGTASVVSAQQAQAAVPDGTYCLINEFSGKALDNLRSTTDATNVGQWAHWGGLPQRWLVSHEGDGLYQLIALYSGTWRALDNGSSNEDGASVIQWRGNGESQQRWQIVDVGGGYQKLICAYSGKALDNGSSTADGARTMQWTDHGGPQQRWRFVPIAGGSRTFTHPGLLHTQADFDRMVAKVQAGEQPWLGSWEKLTASPEAQLSWSPRPQPEVRRGAGTNENFMLLARDVHAAYQTALRWKISGDDRYADKSVEIMNAWSSTLENLGGDQHVALLAGINGYQFANAAEMMRGYPGFDLAGFQAMMLDKFYPRSNWFMLNHSDTCVTHYWANWELGNMATMVAIGALCDDWPIYEQGLEYFRHGAGNGSIGRAVWHLHSSSLGQWQESGRDQAHTIMGVGLMAALCEMAWNQGDDMYGWDGNRFLAGAEYVARYNNGHSVPYETYRWENGHNCDPQQQTVISTNQRGQLRPVWEMILGHYAGRRGLSTPNVAEMVARLRPESGAGGHASTYDQLGLGSLTFAR
ncbi:RICIN domain-containing protein [Phytoactinopolyspora mesophila]|uniref:Ricin B lectin domain-containing protein n=1 Tax=Phytoactinopolyspora mesophila TaxID=2650750 RepID=A0A7K3M1M2_9ACTN|nr:RICIN domain-containing protein [Phytoactinopolyspora mesophila]NDL57193.1 hypothetical protein [Phytoactinopolyspora mesophila]